MDCAAPIRLLAVGALYLIVGCGQADRSASQVSPVPLPATSERDGSVPRGSEEDAATQSGGPQPSGSKGFLGLADDASRKIGEHAPESALAGMTDITEVQVTTHDEYLKRKRNGKIVAKEVRGDFIYFAVERMLHASFPGGSGTYVNITERYKAKLPESEN